MEGSCLRPVLGELKRRLGREHGIGGAADDTANSVQVSDSDPVITKDVIQTASAPITGGVFSKNSWIKLRNNLICGTGGTDVCTGIHLKEDNWNSVVQNSTIIVGSADIRVGISFFKLAQPSCYNNTVIILEGG